MWRIVNAVHITGNVFLSYKYTDYFSMTCFMNFPVIELSQTYEYNRRSLGTALLEQTNVKIPLYNETSHRVN
jgi:hypothetical protein